MSPVHCRKVVQQEPMLGPLTCSRLARGTPLGCVQIPDIGSLSRVLPTMHRSAVTTTLTQSQRVPCKP